MEVKIRVKRLKQGCLQSTLLVPLSGGPDSMESIWDKTKYRQKGKKLV